MPNARRMWLFEYQNCWYNAQYSLTPMKEWPNLLLWTESVPSPCHDTPAVMIQTEAYLIQRVNPLQHVLLSTCSHNPTCQSVIYPVKPTNTTGYLELNDSLNIGAFLYSVPWYMYCICGSWIDTKQYKYENHRSWIDTKQYKSCINRSLTDKTTIHVL